MVLLTRAQDELATGPRGFRDHRHLRKLAQDIAPDRIVCVQPEDAPALSGLGIPLCVDLYAPRLLEGVFEGAVDTEAVHTLRALHAADHVLFSNPRQRWFGLGLMTLAGLPLDACSVVPLVAPDAPERDAPRHVRIVMGGVAWPWQDPVPALERAVAHLTHRRKGKLLVVGVQPTLGDAVGVDLAARVPAGERLTYQGPVPYADLLQIYATSTAFLDVMTPNPERELALSFRHVDALGCGLPLITTSMHPLSADVESAYAGWVDGEIEDVLDQVLDNPADVEERAECALALAALFNLDSSQALVDWVEQGSVRAKTGPVLSGAAELTAQVGRLQGELTAERALREVAEREVAGKRAELEGLNEQVQSLTSTVGRLSRGLDEVAGFRREAVRVLGTQRDAADAERTELARELVDLRADLAKKQAELRTQQREVDRLNDALAAAQDAQSYSAQRLIEAGAREDGLRANVEGMRRQLQGGTLARLLKRR